MPTPPPVDRKRLVKAFWAAVAISVLCNVLQPWGRYALYPFALLGTWAHEMGHGLTALLLGGSFEKLVLFSDLGGYASHTALGFFRRPLVSMGGLLGPSIVGGGLIVLGARSEKTARLALWLLVAALGLSVVIWIRSLFGVVAISAVAVVLAGVALKGGVFAELFMTQLIGIQLCLALVSDVNYMFTKSFQRGGETLLSDTGQIAEHWLLPYWVWGGLIAATSFAILLSAFYVAWIRGMVDDDPTT